MRASCAIAVISILAGAAGCGSSARQAPSGPPLSIRLERSLERGVAAERAATGGRYRLVDVISTQPGGVEELVEWRVRPRQVRRVVMSTNPNGSTRTSITLTIGRYDYLRAPGLATVGTQAKAWLRERSSLDAAFDALPQPAAEALAEVRSGSGVSRVGASSIGGQPVTEYRFTIDVPRLSRVAAAAAPLVSGLYATLRVRRVAARVWIAADGVPLREWLVFRWGGNTETDISTVTLNVPVHVSPPPADQVGTQP